MYKLLDRILDTICWITLVVFVSEVFFCKNILNEYIGE